MNPLSLKERFEGGQSLFHDLDPRIKVVMSLGLILGILLTPEGAFPAYPLIWAVLGSMAVVSRVGVWRLARLGGIALPFTLAALTLIFTTPGQPLLRLGGLVISDTGVVRFMGIALRSWLAAQAAILLSLTTPFTDLLWALRSLRLPSTLVMITAFMYRYLFTLGEEAERLIRARASRSASLPDQKGAGGSLWWRARVAGGMVGSLFLRSYERSERVYAAMLSRGFDGELRGYNPPPFQWRSVLVGAIPLLAVALIQIMAFLWFRGVR